MKSVSPLNPLPPPWINITRLESTPDRPQRLRLRGELGYRITRCIHRLEHELPYSREYLLSQVSGAAGQWSQFPRYHGDIAGRWVLALTWAHSDGPPPEHLRVIVAELLDLQNDDGSFGSIAFEEEPLNMHKAYGNGWMLKALAQYAITFGDTTVAAAARRLGDFVDRTFHVWEEADTTEGGRDNYGVTRSCYFHSLDGLVTLHRLSGEQKYLDLAGKFIPLLTPLEDADHAHMYLTCRRGMLAWLDATDGDIGPLADELDRFRSLHCFETGGTPERVVQCEKHRSDPDRMHYDEACTLFDWELLTLRLHELTGDVSWLQSAVLNLENQIFFNQQYSGGFGHSEFGPHYPMCQIEAPWCCTPFGPFGLLAASAMMVARKGGELLVRHLLSGDFDFGDGVIKLDRDDRAMCFKIRTAPSASPGIVRLATPFWLDVDRTVWDIPEDGELTIPFRYRVWASSWRQPPEQITQLTEHDSAVLFYGPWILAHRFSDPIPCVDLETDRAGFVTNARSDHLFGCGAWGETVRLTLPSNHTTTTHDVSRGIRETSGALPMYPLRSKEDPRQLHTRVLLRRP